MAGSVLEDLGRLVDKDGSLVTVDPADWIVCFVPGLQRQWWHFFANGRHKHVFAIRPTGSGSWLLVEPWWSRMMVTTLGPAEAVKFLRWAETGDMLRVREAIPGRASQFRGWSNCAVLISLLLGRSSRTWTPHGLYRQLLEEESTQQETVEHILGNEIAAIMRRQFGAATLGAEHLALPLKERLFIVGCAVLEAMMTPSLLDLFHAVFAEGQRYPQAADIFDRHGPMLAVDAVAKILTAAKLRGEVDLVDCEAGARQFLGMLRGSFHLDAVLRVAHPPTRFEMECHARDSADLFLDGAMTQSAQAIGNPSRQHITDGISESDGQRGGRIATLDIR
jgi:hypothetical protein